jgi:hypothetical protein
MTLQGLITQAYPAPEWAVFFEVSNGTGSMVRRRADAVALGVWPSRGFTIIGFEFKEDRRDWLREKANPEKADTIAAHCDSWVVVAGSESVVKVDELPEPWGLLVANADRTRLLNKKACQPFPDRDKSVMKRSFVAAMLRKVPETTVPKPELDRLVEERVKAALERTGEGYELKQLQETVERYRAMLDDFKAATGVDLHYGWQGPKAISHAVAAVLSGDSHRERLDRAADDLDHAAKQLRKAVASWPVAEVSS